MNNQCRGMLLEKSVQYYKPIKKEDLNKYPSQAKNKALSPANRSKCTDLWIETNLRIKHLKTLS